MNFDKLIHDWASKAVYQSIHCSNEEQVRDYLVTPFFELLGYRSPDPRIVTPEHVAAGVGRADLVLYSSGRPKIIIECKKVGKTLDHPGRWEQLRNYHRAIPDAKLGVLTNGLAYKFYAETDIAEELDIEPFLEIHLEQAQSGLRGHELDFLSAIAEANFDEAWVENFAEEQLIRRRMISWLSKELRQPSDEFCRLALKNQNVKYVRNLDHYKMRLQEAFAEGLAFEVYNKIKQLPHQNTSGLSLKQKSVQPGVDTTEQELRIYEYAKQTLRRNLAQKEQDSVDHIQFKDSCKKFRVFYMRPAKGFLFDYYEHERKDIFIFKIRDDLDEIIGIENIEKPLVKSFRNRLEQAKSWGPFPSSNGRSQG